MQRLSSGYALTGREALSASVAGTERGFPDVGEATTESMLDYFTDENGLVRREFTRFAVLSDARFALGSLLRASVRSKEEFFVVLYKKLGEAGGQDIGEACEPIENTERAIDSFVSSNFRRSGFLGPRSLHRIKEPDEIPVPPAPPGPPPENIAHRETEGFLGPLTR